MHAQHLQTIHMSIVTCFWWSLRYIFGFVFWILLPSYINDAAAVVTYSLDTTSSMSAHPTHTLSSSSSPFSSAFPLHRPPSCLNFSIPAGHGRNIIGVSRSGTTLLHALLIHAISIQSGMLWNQQAWNPVFKPRYSAYRPPLLTSTATRVPLSLNSVLHRMLSDSNFFYSPQDLEKHDGIMNIIANDNSFDGNLNHDSNGSHDKSSAAFASRFRAQLAHLQVEKLWGGHISQIESPQYHSKYLVHFHPILDNGTLPKHWYKRCLQQELFYNISGPSCAVTYGPTEQLLQYFSGHLWTSQFYMTPQGRFPSLRSSPNVSSLSEPLVENKLNFRPGNAHIDCHDWRILIVQRHPIDILLSQLRWRGGLTVNVSHPFSFETEIASFCEDERRQKNYHKQGQTQPECHKYSVLSQYLYILEW